jgi:hypothetical protein
MTVVLLLVVASGGTMTFPGAEGAAWASEATRVTPIPHSAAEIDIDILQDRAGIGARS